MDGLKAHENLISQIDSEKENIFFHFLVPHSSDQTQPLDLVLFGVMKKFEQNYQKKKDLSQQSNQLIKIISCLYKEATPFNCKAAFKAAGITSKVHINERGDAVELAHFDQKYDITHKNKYSVWQSVEYH